MRIWLVRVRAAKTNEPQISVAAKTKHHLPPPPLILFMTEQLSTVEPVLITFNDGNVADNSDCHQPPQHYRHPRYAYYDQCEMGDKLVARFTTGNKLERQQFSDAIRKIQDNHWYTAGDVVAHRNVVIRMETHPNVCVKGSAITEAAETINRVCQSPACKSTQIFGGRLMLNRQGVYLCVCGRSGGD